MFGSFLRMTQILEKLNVFFTLLGVFCTYFELPCMKWFEKVNNEYSGYLLFKPRKILKNRTSNDLSVETIRCSKRKWGKSGMKFIEFTTKVSRFSNFLHFRQLGENFGPFSKIHFNQKQHRLKIEM